MHTQRINVLRPPMQKRWARSSLRKGAIERTNGRHVWPKPWQKLRCWLRETISVPHGGASGSMIGHRMFSVHTSLARPWKYIILKGKLAKVRLHGIPWQQLIIGMG